MTLMMGRRGEPRIDTGRLKKVAGTGTALDRDALDVRERDTRARKGAAVNALEHEWVIQHGDELLQWCAAPIPRSCG